VGVVINKQVVSIFISGNFIFDIFTLNELKVMASYFGELYG